MPTADPAAPAASARPRRRRALVAAAAGTLVLALGATAVVVQTLGRDDPEWPSGSLDARFPAGAAPLGSDARPVPPGAFIVQAGAPEGGDGSLERPYTRIQDALDRVRETGVIVLRAGVYRDELFIGRSKTVELRAYPGEEVWFDGADPLAGWEHDGSTWRAPWPYAFSSAPSYTGGEDGDEPTWRFLNEDHPFAAHPEQLWIDGEPLTQVGVDEVVEGTFALDPDAGELVLGEDPGDRLVEASTRQRAVHLRSADSAIVGIGFRRYAPSVQTLGALVVEGDRARLVDVVVEDASTTGVFVTGEDVVLERVTVRRSGMLGVAANHADGLAVDGALLERNNVERFNHAPVAGGVKITRSRGVEITGSVVRDNYGHGVWFDQSVKHATVAASDILQNRGHGVFVEISDDVLLVDLVVAGNRRIGAKLNDSSRVRVWRSTLVANGLGIAVLQDDRRASDASVPGHDDRHPDDPDLTWIGSVEIVDCIVGDVRGSSRDSGAQPAAPLWVHDYSDEFTAEQLAPRVSGNVFQRLADRPAVLWAGTAYPDVAAWEDDAETASGNALLAGRRAVDERFAPTEAALAASRTPSTPPDDVAELLGADAGIAPGALPRYAPSPSPSPRRRPARGTSTRKRMAAPPRSAPPASTSGAHPG